MIHELFENQKPLMVAGIVSFVCFLVVAALVLIDPTEMLGINRWIKPMKFFISISIFLWTVAIYFEQLPGRGVSLRRLSWLMIAVFLVEMVVIVGQPLRGQRSHFNVGSALDGALFSIMGIAILILTLAVAYITFIFFTSEFELPGAIVWGMRLGLVVMLLGSVEGGYMSAQLSHAVGAPEGGPGLPIANWSTEAGDLRVAHFLGLHGLQAVPLFALLLERLRPASATLGTAVFATLYAAIFTATFAQALLGRPLIGGF